MEAARPPSTWLSFPVTSRINDQRLRPTITPIIRRSKLSGRSIVRRWMNKSPQRVAVSSPLYGQLHLGVAGVASTLEPPECVVQVMGYDAAHFYREANESWNQPGNLLSTTVVDIIGKLLIPLVVPRPCNNKHNARLPLYSAPSASGAASSSQRGGRLFHAQQSTTHRKT